MNPIHGKTATDRRRFLETAGALTTLPSLMVLPSSTARGQSRAASDRIQVGVIGLGSRGYNLIDGLLSASDRADIVAIADVDAHHFRDRPWGTGKAYGRTPAKEKILAAYRSQGKPVGEQTLSTYTDYRELIQQEGIDAIVVATPDHWHALCTLQALQAGKDVYCEKPVTHFFAEGQRVYREAERCGAVFQTGSQQRSDWRFRRAVELVRNGHLGKIQSIEVGLPPGYDQPQGATQRSNIPEQLDYDFWCGPAPRLPYMRARHHRWWRGHRAFGGGVLMDWIGHHNDIAHWALDLDRSGPSRVEAVDWTYPETDVYNTPHHYTIRCEYRDGIVGTISSRNEQGLKILGEAGWVYVNRGQLRASRLAWTEQAFDPGEIQVYASDDHLGNFLSCIHSRQACIAPAETAHRSITPGHLGYVSQAVSRPLDWDAETETIKDDEEADTLLRSMSYRAPWKLA